MILQNVLFLACLALLAGCANFQYVGETDSLSGNEVSVYTEGKGGAMRGASRAMPPSRADYRGDNCDRLLSPNSKARRESKGADAILITEQQVVSKSESRSVEPRFNISDD
ncbi:MAG: hypothetical protein V8T86_02265 [Victivallis sp.]